MLPAVQKLPGVQGDLKMFNTRLTVMHASCGCRCAERTRLLFVSLQPSAAASPLQQILKMCVLHTTEFLQGYFLLQGFWAGTCSLCSGCLAAAAAGVQSSRLLCGAYSRGPNTLE
jgi:hypothetical protein